MDTAYATVSYPETAPSQLRILDSCEYLFQKSDKNEMFFGVMPSVLEATLRITEIDFPNCEVRALVKQKNDGTKNDITDPEPLLKLLLKFPNQTAIINDGLYAVIVSYLRYQEIPEDKWTEYLLRSDDEHRSCRMVMLKSKKGYLERCGMNYDPEALSCFSVSLTLAEETNGIKTAAPA